MSKEEERYSPTALQKAMAEPLRSEQRVGEFFPRILSRGDLLVIFIVLVLFIPNASLVQYAQATGNNVYLYWIIGTLIFLIPGAVITEQLNRLIPADGSIYVWTHRAMGPLWGFFAGFCAWIPVSLVALGSSDIIVLLVRYMFQLVYGEHVDILAEPWQQGVLILAIIVLTGWLSTLSFPLVIRLAKIVVIGYGIGILCVGVAAVVWLFQGHSPHVPLISGQEGFGPRSMVLASVVMRSLLGVEVPLNMGAEVKEATAAKLFLRWGPLLVLLAYLLCTFGIMVVVPSSIALFPFSNLTVLAIVFGVPAALLLGFALIALCMILTVLYNIAFARILFVAALDHRLPTRLAKVNRSAVPSRAVIFQVVLVFIYAVIAYFIGPPFYPDPATGHDLTFEIYEVAQGVATIIWCISMLFLFLDLPILLRRFRGILVKSNDLFAPIWVLYLCCIIGGLVSILGIWATVGWSWNLDLLPDEHWRIIIISVVLLMLVVGLISAAYPRLLSTLHEQTAVARENARLYADLRIAYEKVSQLDQLKDAFIATASHELRTPLTVVQGYLELLADTDEEMITPEMRRAFINKARRACDELVLLLANIMDASNMHLNTVKLQCVNLSLDEVCQKVLDLFEPLIVKQQRLVTLEIPSEILVRADDTRLKQVLWNLIENALRYSPPLTPLRLTATVDEEHKLVSVHVKDYGLGIPRDKQEIIFDRFVRLDRDMHGDVRGSGLGLAICRQLVEAMHGTISVESTGTRGEGSEFTFTLPMGF